MNLLSVFWSHGKPIPIPLDSVNMMKIASESHFCSYCVKHVVKDSRQLLSTQFTPEILNLTVDYEPGNIICAPQIITDAKNCTLFWHTRQEQAVRCTVSGRQFIYTK